MLRACGTVRQFTRGGSRRRDPRCGRGGRATARGRRSRPRWPAPPARRSRRAATWSKARWLAGVRWAAATAVRRCARSAPLRGFGGAARAAPPVVRCSGSGARGQGFEGERSLPSPVPLCTQWVGWPSCVSTRASPRGWALSRSLCNADASHPSVPDRQSPILRDGGRALLAICQTPGNETASTVLNSNTGRKARRPATNSWWRHSSTDRCTDTASSASRVPATEFRSLRVGCSPRGGTAGVRRSPGDPRPLRPPAAIRHRLRSLRSLFLAASPPQNLLQERRQQKWNSLLGNGTDDIFARALQ